MILDRSSKRVLKPQVNKIHELVMDIQTRFLEALFDDNNELTYSQLFKQFNEEYTQKATRINQSPKSPLKANPYGFYDTFYPIEDKNFKIN